MTADSLRAVEAQNWIRQEGKQSGPGPEGEVTKNTAP